VETPIEIERLTAFLSTQRDIRLAVVFGSLATHRATAASDLDIAIAACGPLAAARRRQLIADLGRLSGRPVDLVDLAVVGEPLLGQILKTGKRLIGERSEWARLISRHVFDEADFMPYRNRILDHRRRLWIGR